MRKILALVGLMLLASSSAMAASPTCLTAGSIACLTAATAPQPTDYVYGVTTGNGGGPEGTPVHFTLSQLGSGGGGSGVQSVTTSGAGITASPNPIISTGSLTVQWNAGVVNTIGSGLSLSGGTLTATGGGGGGVTSFGGATGAIAVGTGLSMAGNTLNATGGGGGSLTVTDGLGHSVAGATNISYGMGTLVGGATPNATVNPTLPNRRVANPVIGHTDMFGVVFASSGTLTIPAINSTAGSELLSNGTSTAVVNESGSVLTVTATPTVNPGGGCVTASGIPVGGTWALSGNAGGSVDCIQTTSTGTAFTAGTPDIFISGTTISTQIPLNVQSGANYTILSSDNTKTIQMTNGAPTTMSIAAAGSAGFPAGWGTAIVAAAAPTTLTPLSGTICNQPSLKLQATQFASIGTGSGTDYSCVLGLPVVVPSGTIATNKFLGYDSNGLLVTAAGGSSGATTVSSGLVPMGTSAIASGTCAAVVTVTATGVASTDTVTVSFNGDPTGIAGFTPGTSGMLSLVPWPSTNAINVKECNDTTASITPGAHTLNYRVMGAGSLYATAIPLGTSSIASGACAAVITVSAPGVATTDTVTMSFNGDPTGVVGYQPSTNGMLTDIPFPGPNTVNIKTCNLTASSITPGAVTMNVKVVR